MPTTVHQLLATANARYLGCVSWGSPIRVQGNGVYVVSLTQDPHSPAGGLASCPVSTASCRAWLDARPELTLDDRRPTPEELALRLSRFWLPDEVVLYVGQTTDTLARRVADFYSTPLGAQRPHAGGHWIKALANLNSLYVHIASASDPKEAEIAMIKRFCDGVSAASRSALRDPLRPFPFANLEWPKGSRKCHGLRGTREPKAKAAVE